MSQSHIREWRGGGLRLTCSSRLNIKLGSRESLMTLRSLPSNLPTYLMNGVKQGKVILNSYPIRWDWALQTGHPVLQTQLLLRIINIFDIYLSFDCSHRSWSRCPWCQSLWRMRWSLKMMKEKWRESLIYCWYCLLTPDCSRLSKHSRVYFVAEFQMKVGTRRPRDRKVSLCHLELNYREQQLCHQPAVIQKYFKFWIYWIGNIWFMN